MITGEDNQQNDAKPTFWGSADDSADASCFCFTVLPDGASSRSAFPAANSCIHCEWPELSFANPNYWCWIIKYTAVNGENKSPSPHIFNLWLLCDEGFCSTELCKSNLDQASMKCTLIPLQPQAGRTIWRILHYFKCALLQKAQLLNFQHVLYL